MSKAKTVFNTYYQLSKPGIIYGNLFTLVAGYLYASRFRIDLLTFAGLVVGTGLVIAGACSWNNWLDRGIDRVMKRTHKRALVTGALTSRQALTYGTTVFALGMVVLVGTQNLLTALLALLAFFAYVVLYGWCKRKTVHGTLVGTISGSLPLVMGYTAVSDRLDLTALLLFLLMATWQMAHFYGIALYRLQDYTAAKLPVMPVVKGVATTIRQTLGYIGLYVIVSLAMVLDGAIGIIPGIILLLIGVIWLMRSVRVRTVVASDVWGKRVFLFSLMVMTCMSVVLAVGQLLP